jgi:acetyl esterase/lipase
MSSEFNRRDLMKWLTVSAASCAAARTSLADDAKIMKRTYTYKTVGQLEIKADLHRADDDAIRPVAMWIHGGALIMGNREGVSRRVQESLLGAGYDPVNEPKAFDPFCPQRNVTKEYPPTLLIHGDRDTDVPYEQSVQMVREFERAGVAHRFVGVPGAGHGLSGGDPKLIDNAYAAVLPFIDKYMK